eukprot:359121-Chlamydomonas_euryale.AAC.4
MYVTKTFSESPQNLQTAEYRFAEERVDFLLGCSEKSSAIDLPNMPSVSTPARLAVSVMGPNTPRSQRASTVRCVKPAAVEAVSTTRQRISHGSSHARSGRHADNTSQRHSPALTAWQSSCSMSVCALTCGKAKEGSTWTPPSSNRNFLHSPPLTVTLFLETE